MPVYEPVRLSCYGGIFEIFKIRNSAFDSMDTDEGSEKSLELFAALSCMLNDSSPYIRMLVSCA
jgi:hypothetical protein